jgi:hypothetical protein
MYWALLVFFLAFFGEVMPLSVLYWMQIVVSNIEMERKRWDDSEISSRETIAADRLEGSLIVGDELVVKQSTNECPSPRRHNFQESFNS